MVAIIDYKMGNVGSVFNALSFLGVHSVISSNHKDIRDASHLVIPGVGAFGAGMANLKKGKLIEILDEEVRVKNKPVLGLCLGMQMLADSGEEGGSSKGLGWISGVSRKLKIDKEKLRIPHVGWNDVSTKKGSILFKGVDKSIFYFVHSFVLSPTQQSIITATCNYGEKFAAAVEKDNIFGAQFHPEKSQSEGLKILDNFTKFSSI